MSSSIDFLGDWSAANESDFIASAWQDEGGANDMWEGTGSFEGATEQGATVTWASAHMRAVRLKAEPPPLQDNSGNQQREPCHLLKKMREKTKKKGWRPK